MPSFLLVLFGGAVLVSLFARRRSAAVMREYASREASGGLSGAEVARSILGAHGLGEFVEVCDYPGMLHDRYDPVRRKLYLRSKVYAGTSVSAVGFAAHEAGHAVQHREAFTQLSLRLSAVRLTQVGGGVALLLVLVGLAAQAISPRLAFMVLAASWGLIMILNLASLPVEFDASRRAKLAMEKLRLVRGLEEHEALDSVLGGAALATVGSLVTSLPFLAYHVIPFFGRRGRAAGRD